MSSQGTAAESAVIMVGDHDFAERIEGASGLSLVDFGAAWCGPCRMMEPVVERLAREHRDVRVASLDVDANPRTAARFGVRNLPTFLLFRDGQEVDRVIGAVPAPVLEARIRSHG